ncbi:hypothetical protein CXF85_08710 [Colwellia sp. 75C3]|uniref:hypothetical protein n=1 Tax=Colwellia sp. 75C3 TaxID=888425 RepID=UPI000C33E332|nr:hypothetical protein [Colwellia sp. 75C3]PKG84392.1 hypothetical protein CXF85_08710 [Colwellia sp. 75C3]
MTQFEYDTAKLEGYLDALNGITQHERFVVRSFPAEGDSDRELEDAIKKAISPSNKEFISLEKIIELEVSNFLQNNIYSTLVNLNDFQAYSVSWNLHHNLLCLSKSSHISDGLDALILGDWYEVKIRSGDKVNLSNLLLVIENNTILITVVTYKS